MKFGLFFRIFQISLKKKFKMRVLGKMLRHFICYVTGNSIQNGEAVNPSN